MHPVLPHSTPLVTLAAAQPFDLALSLRAMSGFAPCAGEQRIFGSLVRKAFSLADGRAVVAEVAPAERGVSLVLHSAEQLSGAERHQVEVAVGRWLSLSDDPAPFLAAARADPALAPVLAETEGLHQLRFASVAEGACYFVLAQRTSQAQAGGRKRRLARVYGSSLELGGITYRAFPTLDRLAGLTVGELAPFTANLRQSEYLAAVLSRLASWPLGWGHRVGTDELMAELRDIRGVGEFTASGIALRVFGRLDVAPAELPVFTRAIEALYGPGVSMAELAARYGDQIGLWGYHVRTGLGWISDGSAGRAADAWSVEPDGAPVRPARAGSSARTPEPHRRAG
jgi:3-methyladenine DNA glycosylase/8-oxoguanine DNA glycosylase